MILWLPSCCLPTCCREPCLWLLKVSGAARVLHHVYACITVSSDIKENYKMKGNKGGRLSCILNFYRHHVRWGRFASDEFHVDNKKMSPLCRAYYRLSFIVRRQGVITFKLECGAARANPELFGLLRVRSALSLAAHPATCVALRARQHADAGVILIIENVLFALPRNHNSSAMLS